MTPINQPKFLKETEPSMISHLQASSNYTVLTMKNGKKLISAYHLKAFEILFSDKDFIRIDRANLVNSSFIKRTLLSDHGIYIQLKNKEEILVPRRRKAMLQEKYPNLFITSQTTL